MESDRTISTEQLIASLKPFAEIGAWLFARNLPDETPVVEINGLNGAAGCLTRGDFKAAFNAMRALEGMQEHDDAAHGAPGPSDPSSTRSDVTASLEGDAVERVARIKSLLVSFHRNSCYPEAMTGELNDAAERILATGLVPDEAAVRAEITEARQEAADSLAILDAIADYVGCPHDEELTVDHVRQHYLKLEDAAQRQGIEDAGRIANAQAYGAAREQAIRADERERCAKVADGWLAQFAHHEIKYVSARMYASDAIQDIATAIRKMPQEVKHEAE